MSAVLCRVCTAKTDAYLCRDCTRQLEQAIAELPADLADLQRAATRQIAAPLGLGDPRRQWQAPAAEPSVLPAHLRSAHEAGALVSTAWPFAPGPADLLWVSANTLGVWCSYIAATLGQPVPRGAAMVGWLLANLDAVRRNDYAAQIYDEFTWLRAETNTTILGRVLQLDYYGKCRVTDVSVVPLRIAGPPCTTLVCGHDTCAVIRGDIVIFDARIGECGQDLYGDPSAAVITCRACGTDYDAAEQKRVLLKMLPDQLATTRAIADGLSKLNEPVTVARIDGWIRRGRLMPRGVDADGHRLVKVGDVQELVDALTSRPAARASA